MQVENPKAYCGYCVRYKDSATGKYVMTTSKRFTNYLKFKCCECSKKQKYTKNAK